MPNVFITGAFGFIGQQLVQTLIKTGHEVKYWPKGLNLCDRSLVRTILSALGPIDYIIHAADISGNAGWAAAHAATQFMINSSMALNLLEAWRDFHMAARFIGFSSLLAYPEHIETVTETTYWDGQMYRPTEQYGMSKKLLGMGIQTMRREHGMCGTMLVLGNVYGPNDNSTRIIPSLIRKILLKPSILEVLGAESVTRDFVYIDDQIAGIVRHLDYDGELLNITTGTSHTIKEVVDILCGLLNFKGEIKYVTQQCLGVTNRHVDVTLAASLTGWPWACRLQPLEDGLKHTVEWVLKTIPCN